jgi:hypothetical protein
MKILFCKYPRGLPRLRYADAPEGCDVATAKLAEPIRRWGLMPESAGSYAKNSNLLKYNDFLDAVFSAKPEKV